MVDDTAGPGVEVNAHWLSEAAHHVEGESKPRGRCLGDGFFVSIVVLFLIFCNRGRALERPQEERGQAGVLFQRAGQTVARLRLCGVEHLFQRGAADDLPDFLQVIGQADYIALGGLDGAVMAEDFERRADAGENQIGTTDAFGLQALDPVSDADRQFPQDIGPVADGSVLGTRAADEVDTGGERGGIAGTKTRRHFSSNRPRAGDGPTTANHAGEQRLPPLSGFVGKDNGADTIFA